MKARRRSGHWVIIEPGQEHRKTHRVGGQRRHTILYNVQPGSYDHSALHQTLLAWANTYRDGVQGKAIVVKRALLRDHQAALKQTTSSARMLWALSDTVGLPAKRFADFKSHSVARLAIGALDERFKQTDPTRFHVPLTKRVGGKPSF